MGREFDAVIQQIDADLHKGIRFRQHHVGLALAAV
jgi:hypothetical protein